MLEIPNLSAHDLQWLVCCLDKTIIWQVVNLILFYKFERLLQLSAKVMIIIILISKRYTSPMCCLMQGSCFICSNF